MRHLRFIIAIILMLMVVSIVVQNHEAMSTDVEFRINLVFAEYTSSAMTLYSVVIIAFLFGVLVTGFYGMMERFRLKKDIKVLLGDVREKDKELNSLRNLPITADDVPPAQVDNHEET